MRIACADCGCVVDRGLILERCDKHPDCCCADLDGRESAEAS